MPITETKLFLYWEKLLPFQTRLSASPCGVLQSQLVIFHFISKLRKPSSHTCCFWCGPKHGMKGYSRLLTRTASGQAEILSQGTNIFRTLEPGIHFSFKVFLLEPRAENTNHITSACTAISWNGNKTGNLLTESHSTVQREKEPLLEQLIWGMAIIWKELFNPSLQSDLFRSKGHSYASLLSCTEIFL